MNKLITKTVCNNFISSTGLNISRALCYKSDLSLKTLYPNSNDKLFTPPLPTRPSSNAPFTGVIPIKNLQITYSRSSGPGGQNVNCVDTKCDVRFHVASAEWLSESTRAAILEHYRGKVTKEGYFVLKNDKTRYQQVNLADALEMLRNIIRDLERPKQKELSPETKAKIVARQAKADRERIQIKRDRSAVKSERQSSGEML